MSETLAIDVGNSVIHWGHFCGLDLTESGGFSRVAFAERFPEVLDRFPRAAISWCSVAPSTASVLESLFKENGRSAWRLTCDTVKGLAIAYPGPEQIGQDRLANAVAAQRLVGVPAVVIDMGTATTFDAVTSSGGYIGGVIAPGLASMTEYLHEKTEQLPRLKPGELLPGPRIGRSTIEAMSVGCTRGFPGMIRALLDGVYEEFAALGEPDPTVLLTGGAAQGFLREALWEFRAEPHLTLIGLAEGWRRFSRMSV